MLGISGWGSSLVRWKICKLVNWSFFRSCSVFFCVCYFLCKFFYDFFYRLDISAFCRVFLLFFVLYVFCYNCSTIFASPKSFSFSKLSRNFLSVNDVIQFDMRNSMLKSAKTHFFSISINFSQCTSGVCVSDCFAQKKSVCEFDLFLFGKQHL